MGLSVNDCLGTSMCIGQVVLACFCANFGQGFLQIGRGIHINMADTRACFDAGHLGAVHAGADEALAYDTLVENKMEDSWPLVLDWQMRVQNLGFIFAMGIGMLIQYRRKLKSFPYILGKEGEIL